MSNTPEYRAWANLKSRCSNMNDPHYANYGGRGITVCERWANSFAAFYADMGPRPADFQIDRIDNNGNYEPSNCKWVMREENLRNQRPVVVAPLCSFCGTLFVSSRRARFCSQRCRIDAWRKRYSRSHT